MALRGAASVPVRTLRYLRSSWPVVALPVSQVGRQLATSAATLLVPHVWRDAKEEGAACAAGDRGVV